MGLKCSLMYDNVGFLHNALVNFAEYYQNNVSLLFPTEISSFARNTYLDTDLRLREFRFLLLKGFLMKLTFSQSEKRRQYVYRQWEDDGRILFRRYTIERL